MRIGIVGAGHIGATLARLLVTAGHEVAISNSAGPTSLGRLVGELGPRARALTPEEAVAYGEVVILAVPWPQRLHLPAPDLFEKKIVVDTMNPFSTSSSGIDLDVVSSSEEVARQFPKARVVKAFNTLYWETLATRGTIHVSHRIVLPLSGPDAEAKSIVATLISECGFAPLDLGDFRKGQELAQPGKLLYNKALTLAEAKGILC